MFRVIDLETGASVNLDYAVVETECPDCGKLHREDLENMVILMTDLGSSWADMKVYCEDCSSRRLATQRV